MSDSEFGFHSAEGATSLRLQKLLDGTHGTCGVVNYGELLKPLSPEGMGLGIRGNSGWGTVCKRREPIKLFAQKR